MANDQDINEIVPADAGPDIIVLRFADSKVPVFKESRNRDYIKYGEKNNYPEYLTLLYNKSAKHNAILTGKANYIFGEGFENGDQVINRLGESLNDISKKAILDIEVYGGFRLEIIWNAARKIAEIYHVDYSSIRVAKDGGFYYKEAWNLTREDGCVVDNSREEEQYISCFDPSNPIGSQIFAYNEYRPMTRFYPLPSYIGCNNYIETDIEISKYYLSAIRNGMMPSKMVQFYEGEPTDEKKRIIEKRFEKKFSGAENAGRFILVFNKAKDKSVDISDLSASEVDKQFVELNKTCQQEIFSGHLVTSPMLFGIKTEGQLGGNNELQIAYSIFQNTYAKPKASVFSKEIEYLFSYSNYPGEYDLRPTDPIGLQFDVKDVIQSLPKSFVFKKLGVPEEEWGNPSISGVEPMQPGAKGIPAASEAALANDNVKNLTAKQHQQLMRIIRQYGKGQLTELAAKALLRTGLGLTDTDITELLGIQPAAMSAQENEDSILAMFDECGESQSDYEILRSKKVCFSSHLECEEDEEIYIQTAFKYDVSNSESQILELIKKDSKITPEVLAETLNQTVAFIKSKIALLVRRGYLQINTIQVGEDLVTERTMPKGLDLIKPPTLIHKENPSIIAIKYSYDGPQDDRNRPFCARMMALKRLYSRAEIERISERLGYSVFDRRGGFYTRKGTNDTTPYCRHYFSSHIVVMKKGGEK